MSDCNKTKCAKNCRCDSSPCQSGPPGALGPTGVPDMPYQAHIQLMETTTKPVEALLSAGELAQIFVELAKTGIKKLDFSSPSLQELSFQIVRLVAENKHLRKLLHLESTDDLDVKVIDSEFHVMFGPRGEYILRVPLENGGELLAERLRRVADDLNAGQKDLQLTLFDN